MKMKSRVLAPRPEINNILPKQQKGNNAMPQTSVS
jgi:hypothetical protein